MRGGKRRGPRGWGAPLYHLRGRSGLRPPACTDETAMNTDTPGDPPPAYGPSRGSCFFGLRRDVLVLMLCAPLLQAAEASSPIQLTDVTRQTGITFVHTDGGSGRRYIVESVASGLATFDYNGDGKIDILFLNGAPLPGSRIPPPPRNALYRNDGGWKFSDVTLAGVGLARPGGGTHSARG